MKCLENEGTDCSAWSNRRTVVDIFGGERASCSNNFASQPIFRCTIGSAISPNLPASIVLPELDGRNSEIEAQSATIKSVLEALDRRSKTLLAAANDVLEMEPPEETAYNPISSADAVIEYAENFIPSWAGAIAIDLLPAILVFILAVTQSAIRQNEDSLAMEDSLTLAELKTSVNALKKLI